MNSAFVGRLVGEVVATVGVVISLATVGVVISLTTVGVVSSLTTLGVVSSFTTVDGPSSLASMDVESLVAAGWLLCTVIVEDISMKVVTTAIRVAVVVDVSSVDASCLFDVVTVVVAPYSMDSVSG